MTASEVFRSRNIIIVELDGTMPRRDKSLPHLYVANTVDSPIKNLTNPARAGEVPVFMRKRHSGAGRDEKNGE